jgi:hypothetical protein
MKKAILLSVFVLLSLFRCSLFQGSYVPPDEYTEISRIGITLSESPLFMTTQQYLSVVSNMNEKGTTYADISLEEMFKTSGQYLDPEHQFLAYSFYLQNIGQEIIMINYHMEIRDVLNASDEIVRIMVIIDDDFEQIYQKSDSTESNNEASYDMDVIQSTFFESEEIVFRNTIVNFRPGEVVLFRVVMWLESQDPQFQQQSGHFEANLIFIIKEEEPIKTEYTQLFTNESSSLWINTRMMCTVSFSLYY